MAKNDIDRPIPDLNEPWENYIGERVEEFLKRFLQGLDAHKHGAWLMTAGEGGLNTLRAFADEASRDAWQADPEGAADLVLAQTSFFTSKTEETNFSLATRITAQPASDMVRGSSNEVRFTYSSYYGEDATDLDTEAGYARVWVNNTEVPALALSLAAGGAEHSIDLGPYLVQENNTVRLEVGNAHGKSRTFNYSIRALEIALSLDGSYDESLVRDGAWALRVACRGVAAQVHVSVDGSEVAQGTVTNSTRDFTIDASGTLAPGAHRVELYAENAEYGIRSATLTTWFIKRGLGKASVCIGTGADTEVTLYGTASVPYFLYYPNAGGQQVQVSFEVRDGAGIVLAELTPQTLTLQADGTSGLQQLRVAVADNAYLAAGSIVVAVRVTGAEATHALAVKDAGVTLAAADECKVYLSAAGRTNADADAEDWHSEYGGVRTCTVRRSDNFKLTGDNGFNGSGFLIKAGKRITLDGLLPFGSDFGANARDASARTGRTVEFELSTRNCTDSEAKIVDCMDGGVGFAIYANRIVLSSEAGGEVETIYTDEQKVRVGFCIDGTTTHCINQLIDGTEESEANIAYVYVNGVIVRMMDYKTSSWQQPAAQRITIGSDACDVELYTVRVYDKSLTPAQMLGNYAYDTPLLEEKLAIARRNNILDSAGAVDFAKTLAALPDTPYKIWEIAKMPTGKKDWQECTTEFVNPAWDRSRGDEPAARASFVCAGHDIALDGTSSLSYPDPYKNWANRYNGEWTVQVADTRLTITGYSITDGVAAEATEFVDKVNFASSEGIFNILAANAYQNILLATARQYPDLLTRRQAAQQAAGEAVTFRQSLSGFPIIGWLRTRQADGSASVRFLSIYNFINNKYDPTYFGFANDGLDELWEVEDNVNFFSEELPAGEWAEGKWADRATTLYYARVPKTSPVTGADYGTAANGTQTSQANSESARLRRFHNWVYSCNPNIAERYRLVNGSYRRLDAPVTYGDTTYDYDTPAYRLAKFDAEHAAYINKSSALFYFIFFGWTLGVDSMDKNMTVGFEDVQGEEAPRAFFVQRDSDTGFDYGNRGTLLYKVFHEWGDSYDESTGQTGRILGESYDAAAKTFAVATSAGSPVFNGRLSGLWDCVAGAWADDIKAMYQAMRANGLNESAMWALYNSFWSQWCEALYNADGMGYATTGRFDMAHGDKREVLRHYFKYRQRYWDSKCGANTGNSLELRLWGNGNGVVLRHCCPLYASLNWGAGGIQTVRSITPGEPAYFENPGVTFNETTFTVYDADLVTDLATYTELPDGTRVEGGLQDIAASLDMTGLEYCRRLERLELDYSGKAPNTNLTGRVTAVGNSRALRRLVIRNAPNVTGAFNLQSEKVEEVDLRDTGATALTVPPTDTLHSVRLGAGIRALSFADFPNLRTLTLQGFGQLATVDIEGCPQVDTRTLIEDIVAADDCALRTVRLHGVDWRGISVEVLGRLADMKADLTGRIELPTATIVNFDLKRRLIEAWGNVDDQRNPLYIKYTLRDLTTVTIGGSRYVDAPTPADQPDKYRMTLKSDTVNANNFTDIRWSIAANQYATIDERTGVLHVTAVGTADRAPQARVSVEITLGDGSVLTESTTVGFYKRNPQIGDYVYADGTSSDILDTDKTVVGVCFYVDPDAPDAAGHRLCVGCADLPSNPFGLNNNQHAGANNIFSSITLADSPNYSVFNIPTLVDKKSCGISSGNITDNNFRDETSTGDPYGFKVFSKADALGEIGFETLTERLGSHGEGEQLPWGLINTLKIIAHRDRILADSNVNLPQPRQSGSTSEYQNLLDLLGDVVADNGGQAKYKQFYYPAASLCHAYEPGVKAGEALAECFKAGGWFLPSAGELGRLYWYHKQGYVAEVDNAIFAAAAAGGGFAKFGSALYWASTELSAYYQWCINFSSSEVRNIEGKFASDRIRPVAAF